MKFRIDDTSPIPIYEQIKNGIIQMIALGDFKENEKIPSVRDIAVALKVNPNTVSRAFTELIKEKIIYTKRGIGNFVGNGAEDLCKKKVYKRVLSNINQELTILKKAGFDKKAIEQIINDMRSK